MITDEFVTLLMRRVREERERQTEILATGNIIDHGQYRDHCGYLRALSDIEVWSRQIIKDMTGDK